MPKPIGELTKAGTETTGSNGASDVDARQSELAELVSKYLRTKGMRQVDFCRRTGFDQGLLSKILSSVVTTLNVESALKLADGLGLPPGVVFESIGKKDVDALLRKFYRNTETVN
jgi:transcriptional regulator with XRE-family HTH domain